MDYVSNDAPRVCLIRVGLPEELDPFAEER